LDIEIKDEVLISGRVMELPWSHALLDLLSRDTEWVGFGFWEKYIKKIEITSKFLNT
jgi:hypothetical protein